MNRHIVQRLLAVIPVLLLVSLGVFMLIHIIPGDPVTTMLGERADPTTIAQLREAYGLDRPLPLQFVEWLWQLFQGNLGQSIRSPQTVTEAIGQRLIVTLELTGLAMLFSLLIALPLGILAAVYRGSWVDRFTSVLASIGVAVPSFWLGIIFLLVFSLYLHWLPSAGYVSFASDPVENIRRMILPALSLALALSAEVARMTRASLSEILSQEFIRTARSKGLDEPAILLRHCLKLAFIPVVTIIGLQIGRLFGGAVVVETVFALPGLGRLLVDSIFTRDFPVVQGVVLIIATSVVLINLGVDLLYSYLDPRIRYG